MCNHTTRMHDVRILLQVAHTQPPHAPRPAAAEAADQSNNPMPLNAFECRASNQVSLMHILQILCSRHDQGQETDRKSVV